jgi:hypothetical protein
MRRKHLPLLAALSVLMLASLACQMLTSRLTPSSTPPPKATKMSTATKVSLPATKTSPSNAQATKEDTLEPTAMPKGATPTPTLKGRTTTGPTMVPTATNIPPTRSASQLDECINALPVASMPVAMEMMSSGNTQNAHPLLVCDNYVDNTNGWEEGEFNGDYVTSGSSSIEGGAYFWRGYSNDGAVWYEFPPNGGVVSDFAVVVDARILTGPEGTKVGIYYRYNESSDNFYLFSVSRTEYEVYIYYEGDWEELISSTPVPEGFDIDAGDAWIAVDVVGDLHTFYINNESVAMWTDDRISSGEVGIGMELEANPDVEASADFYHFVLRGE